MKKKTIAVFFLISCAYGADLPLIGLDDRGKPTEILVQKDFWNSEMNKAIETLSESTLYSLNKQNSSFSKVALGTLVKMKLGVGDLVKVTAEPYFKLYFSKK